MPKDIHFYLSKGFDQPMAEYFAAGRKRITAVTPNEDFTLTLVFDHNEHRLYNCRPFFTKGTVFEPFMQYQNFKRVYLDEQHCVSWDIDPAVDSNVVWNNKVDLCPDSCYVDSTPIGGDPLA